MVFARSLNEAFIEWLSMSSLFTLCDHRKSTIITVMIYSPSHSGLSQPDDGLTETSWGAVMLNSNQSHESDSPLTSCHTRIQSPQRQKQHVTSKQTGYSDRQQDRRRSLTSQLSVELLQNQAGELRGEMSQHSLSLSPVSPNTRAAVNPETPVSSLDICHILSKQTCYATVTNCYATVIQSIFSSWVFFLFVFLF